MWLYLCSFGKSFLGRQNWISHIRTNWTESNSNLDRFQYSFLLNKTKQNTMKTPAYSATSYLQKTLETETRQFSVLQHVTHCTLQYVTICSDHHQRWSKDSPKNISHAQINPVNYMKKVQEYNKTMCPYINKIAMLQQRVRSTNTSYALRRQTIFTQIVPAKGNHNKLVQNGRKINFLTSRGSHKVLFTIVSILSIYHPHLNLPAPAEYKK